MLFKTYIIYSQLAATPSNIKEPSRVNGLSYVDFVKWITNPTYQDAFLSILCQLSNMQTSEKMQVVLYNACGWDLITIVIHVEILAQI